MSLCLKSAYFDSHKSLQKYLPRDFVFLFPLSDTRENITVLINSIIFSTLKKNESFLACFVIRETAFSLTYK